MPGVVMRRAERFGHAAPTPGRVATEIAVVSVLAGVLMGVLWWLLSPEVTGVVVEGGLAADAREGQKMFDRDAVFALLGAGFGLVLAVVYSVRHWRSPVTTLVTLALAGVAGSYLATLVGGLFGPGGDVAGLENGTQEPFPLRMESPAGLLVWSMVATVVVAVVALFREDRAPWSVPGNPPGR
ncbi:DUF2567 domain-containing protein [Jiangella asiatica]|uniref:DUF2567 domain-containing protein n=1 Tax=Jiangella asiatica TaxID=2530372 RepID=A0A4V2Z2B3_9ACTN|nr:DUF2567 domain-containing protein [Jiangella asiatica]TDE08078.1 DUF2567 domain-containing protein [Jiangella asiatica]